MLVGDYCRQKRRVVYSRRWGKRECLHVNAERILRRNRLREDLKGENDEKGFLDTAAANFFDIR